MLSHAHDGGPAFPRTASEGNEDSQDGMSVKDYFAARFAAALFAGGTKAPAEIAKASYDLADAMITERHNRAGL